MATNVVIFILLFFVYSNNYIVASKNSNYKHLNVIHSTGKTIDKVNEPVKTSVQYRKGENYMGIVNTNVNKESVKGKVCNDKNCDNPKNIKDPYTIPPSWRYRNRVRRAAPKIYPRTSVTLWSRRNRNTNQLEVRRRSVGKLRYKLSHSPGIKQQPPKTNEKVVIKRSIEIQNVVPEEDQTSTPEIVSVRADSSDELGTIENLEVETTTRQENDTYEKMFTTVFLQMETTIQRTDDDKQNDLKSQNKSLAKTENITEVTSPTLEKIKENQSSEHPRESNQTKDSNYVSTTLDLNLIDSETGHDKINNVTAIPIILPNNVKSDTNLTINTDLNKTSQIFEEERLIIDQTISSIHDDISKNIILDETDNFINSSTNIPLNIESTTLKSSTEQDLANTTTCNKTITNSTTETSNQPTENQTTSNILSEASTVNPKNKVKKIKQIKANPEMAKWIKGNLYQLPVISVPYRKCPQGQRIRKGKCVQVF